MNTPHEFSMQTRFSRFLAAFLLVYLMPACGVARQLCLPDGDDRTLQAALDQKNEVLLCPGSVFSLKNTVMFSRPGQTLATQGSPAVAKQALLIVSDRQVVTAIRSRQSATQIHHLRIDGGRRTLGRYPKGGALIEVGGSGVTGVSIHHVRAWDPRGWSVVHAFEGDKTCSGIRIENNHIGPAGSSNGEWADGISLACKNSLVANNLVSDATDGGIVIFGAPNSVIENNRIVTRNAVLLGAINMVDFKPYDGDFTGTVVRNNEIEAKGGYIKIAIAIGPSVWGADADQYIRGGRVLNNRIRGVGRVGFGIAIDGVKDFEVLGNRNSAGFAGRWGDRCYPEWRHIPETAKLAWVRNYKRSQGRFQPEFDHQVIRYAICVVQR